MEKYKMPINNRYKYVEYSKSKYRLIVLILTCCIISFNIETTLQQNAAAAAANDDDLAFYYKEKGVLEDPVFSKTSTSTSSMHSSSRRSPSRQYKTTSTKAQISKSTSTSKTISKTQTSSPSVTSSSVSAASSAPSSVTPPFIYSTETLNQTHANFFKNWIDVKSDELYELSMNYSGYKLLNSTYNQELRKDAGFAWINFTEMIINISNTIGQVMHHKTLIVKNLTEAVERAFDEYRNDSIKILKSANYLYYDAKSPKTFCDVQESKNRANQNSSTTTVSPKDTNHATVVTSTTLSSSGTTSKQKSDKNKNNPLKNLTNLEEAKSKMRRSHINFDIFDKEIDNNGLLLKNKKHLKLPDDNNDDEDDDEGEIDDEVIQNPHWLENMELNFTRETFLNDNSLFCPYENIFPHVHHHHKTDHYHERFHELNFSKKNKVLYKRQTQNKKPGGGGGGGGNQRMNNTRGGGGGRGPGGGKPGTKIPGSGRPGTGGPRSSTSRQFTTTTTTPVSSLYYDESDERTDLEAYDDYYSIAIELQNEKTPYWNISCINRTFDENFKNFQKGVNRNQSTVHVPTNVYKQDITINITAFWTEELNEVFKANYDYDNELFWQYFCSSTGLFRRYPGAYWTVPQNEDFFDCRLQSWYIMAAASPKDVLILFDRSGSMTGIRLEIAKKLVQAIMDTLSDNDFFNVLTFANTVDYLMNLNNETQYRERFIQAGKANKQKFLDKLRWFKNTSNIADFDAALTMSFELLLNNKLDSDSCGCNKVIMIITDGASDNSEKIFQKYNWNNGRKVRVFTFLIGRDQYDPRQVEWMACANDGKFFHVATLADVNEHAHEYIPVLSRPMALTGHHETTWSNVFVGHLDKELKIAVARPAFRTKESLIAKSFINNKPPVTSDDPTTTLLTTATEATTSEAQYSDYTEDPEYQTDYPDYGDYGEGSGAEEGSGQVESDVKIETEEETTTKIPEFPKKEIDLEEQERLRALAEEALKSQQVLLGVVGVDVPVLRLISKVSPKYQMGVGIYIIMLDNNGFIVFHPSIKKEIGSSQADFKGTSNSIDLDRFEIPIDNDDEFEELEHEMIDQITSNKTLDNWKREGLRVIKRRTEYVYTPVTGTPFSVAIASPNSFGRYYIDLPSEKETDYENRLKTLMRLKFDTNIQLYNCTYNYSRLVEKILNPKQYSDYCIRYLFSDTDQVLAIKSDLAFHEIYYNKFNFSMFSAYPNLVKSSFYGTYSGITFYLPVTFYKVKPGVPLVINRPPNFHQQNRFTPTNNKVPVTDQYKTESTTRETTLETTMSDITEPPSEMTINVELGSIMEPYSLQSTKPTLVSLSSNSSNRTLNGPPPLNESESYYMSLNLFSTESNKHTYSFEKQYYTRSIEFSDYLRTEFNYSKPMVNYFLNESSKEARRDTVGATIPIWLDKVPTAVTGVVYESHLLQQFLFENFMVPNCEHSSCRNLCSQKRGMNLTCYLVDEHGIVVLSTIEKLSRYTKEPIMGQPLYKVNPWLMKILEYEGIYDLVIPGKTLQECKQLPLTRSKANTITSVIKVIVNTVCYVIYQLFIFIVNSIVNFIMYLYGSSLVGDKDIKYSYLPKLTGVNGQIEKNPSLADRIRMFNNEWRAKSSHCYYFGVYSFNLTKWNSLDSSELRVWCNSTNDIKRKFLVGRVKHSNLIMLVIEDEFELIHCGNITQLIRHYEPDKFKEDTLGNETNSTDIDGYAAFQNNTFSSSLMNDFFIAPSLNESMFMNDSNYSNMSLSSSDKKKDFTINRYRKKTNSCWNFFPDEKDYLPCSNKAIIPRYHRNNINFIYFACSLNLILIFKRFY